MSHFRTPLFSVSFLVVLLFPSFVLSSAAQSRAVGDSLRAAGDLLAAVDAYTEVYDQTRPDERGGEEGISYALASTYALHLDYLDPAFKHLEEALPAMESMRVLYDPDLYFMTEDPRWEHIEQTMLDRLSMQVSGVFDRELARKLFRMRRNEWVGRYHMMLLFRQSAGQSPVLTLLSHAMGKRHEKNQAVLLDILDDGGWPPLSTVGEEAAFAAANTLTHMDLEMRLQILPVMKRACEAGEADWYEYAPSLDRTELESGRPQVYGTQMMLDERSGEYVPQPMTDPEHVDERRAAKGMEPIADQLARFNAAMKRDFQDR
ncbi:MAG: hypothetical protein RIE53_07310 [Rhodothermales bacterium]